jgi:hypothetical protein
MILLITLVAKSFSTHDVMIGEIYSSLGIILGAFASHDLSGKQNENYN